LVAVSSVRFGEIEFILFWRRRRIGSFSPLFGCLSALSLDTFSRLSLSALSLSFDRSFPTFSAVFSWVLLVLLPLSSFDV
jgi:hypothetical protein